jgi:hypothetical protein
MANKAIRSIKLTDTLTISECKDGYWLYDKTRKMNLSMRAKTEQDAYVDTITYYQKRCTEIEQKKKKLYDSVNNFIESLSDNDEVDMPCDCDDY